MNNPIQATGSPADWFFEDFAVDQVFHTQGRTITEADIVSFAGWSWDTNPVHTDAVHSAAGRFGEPIAHGLLGLSVALGLVSRLGVFERCSIALLGIDGWRFEHPVVVGDTVRCTLRITGTRATSNGTAGILDRELILTNQDDTVVQRGNIGLMVARRPS
jgi:Acyl dehydratase